MKKLTNLESIAQQAKQERAGKPVKDLTCALRRCAAGSPH